MKFLKKSDFIIYFLLVISSSVFSQNSYRYFLNLNSIDNDQLRVKLIPPAIKSDSVILRFPAMVPGTYSIYDFGRFIKNLEVSGKNNKKIRTERLDINSYLIYNPNDVTEISYLVEDSWDSKDTGEIIFEPAGTKFDKEKEFILNNHGVFGYFNGYENKPFEIEIIKPDKFYPATGIFDLSVGKEKDLLKVGTYHELVDSPILYSLPDTTSINVAGTNVLIAVHSPNKRISSLFIANNISDILHAQKKYLGGKLPVEKYAFLFSFTDSLTRSGSTGALEHSYSSMYVLFESDTSEIRQMVRDVASHEFFHIVTPLNIHSEEIGNFNFNEPKMSRHLWLYEGMTEYSAHHVQVMNGLIDLDDFFNTMRQKTINAEDYFTDTLPFTKMSLGCLKEYKSQYGNVYEKGALISMCLDILLNYYSKGSYNTRLLMADLSKKFGKNLSFKDGELFDVIEKLTFPEIRTFLDLYVDGSRALSFSEVFRKVGIIFTKEKTESEVTLGGVDWGLNPESKNLVVEGIENLDEFGKKIGFLVDDEMTSFNGQLISVLNAREIFYGFLESAKPGENLTVEVLRKNKKGKKEIKKLSTKIISTLVRYRNVLEPDPLANPEELFIRKVWLEGNN